MKHSIITRSPKQFFLLFIFALIVAALSSCSHSANKSSEEKTAGNGLPAVLRFKKQTLIDKEGTGKECATFLAPEGWKVDASVRWNINDVQLPATTSVIIADEKSGRMLQGFPNSVYLVSTDPDMAEEFPAGSKLYAAKILNVKPTVADLIKSEIIPAYRNMNDVKVTSEKDLSVSEANHNQSSYYKNTDSKSGMVSIEYEENGKEMEENIFGTITTMAVDQYTQYVYLSMCYGCKAPKGELKNVMGIYETVLNSVKTNPQWSATFNQVAMMVMKKAFNGGGNYNGGGQNGYNDQYGYNGGGNNYNGNGGGSGGGGYASGNFGSLNDYIGAASNYSSDASMSAYENQQRSEDRVFESYSDQMLGYQNYTDPNSGDVSKLPSGYENAWTDNSGNYVLSNGGYDPNTSGSTSSWTPLETGGSTSDAGSGGDQ
ncbi:MAG TPA: hypothetical protein VE978_16585 [Chitinophagales bacterium]|nr:hypothetical protein [Chitinophagales bacterium]